VQDQTVQASFRGGGGAAHVRNRLAGNEDDIAGLRPGLAQPEFQTAQLVAALAQQYGVVPLDPQALMAVQSLNTR
jgi:hypothetical protein